MNIEMSYKKFERKSERYNKFEHAKILAIVDEDGDIQGYDWTLTQNAMDYFADPEDRKKYAAITVIPVICESTDELQEKFRVAMIYMQLGAALVTPEAMKMMNRLRERRGSVEWMNHVNDCGMMSTLQGIVTLPDSYDAPCGLKVSPRARGDFVDFEDEVGPEDEDYDQLQSLRVVNEKLKEAEYKLGDRIQLCIVDNESKRRKQTWVTVVACHNQMWIKDEDHFVEDEYIGRKDGDGSLLIQFNPKHVLQHKSDQSESKESESDSDDSD